MKINTSVIKHLICALVMFATISMWADVVPEPYEARMMWMERERVMKIVVQAISCPVFVIFLVLFISSLRKGRPLYLVWLACCAPPVFFLTAIHISSDRAGWVLFWSVLCIAAASWLSSVVFLFRGRKFAEALSVLIAVPIYFVSFYLFLGYVLAEVLG